MTSRPCQLRAARILLGWDLKELSARFRRQRSDPEKRYERDGLGGQLATIRNVLEAYKDAGVEFPRACGVTLLEPTPREPQKREPRQITCA